MLTLLETYSVQTLDLKLDAFFETQACSSKKSVVKESGQNEQYIESPFQIIKKHLRWGDNRKRARTKRKQSRGKRVLPDKKRNR